MPQVALRRVASPRNSLAAIGQHWPKSGAGDGNRKYRSGDDNLVESECYELARPPRVIIV
jgi:hypothetical protein